MGQAPTITEAAIRNLTRPQSYDRGEDYYEHDAVRGITRRGSLLRAAVEGSQDGAQQAGTTESTASR